jgi:hypothetical protein
LHRADLRLLGSHDLLGELSREWIATVHQDETSHVDRALMVGDHHGQEVAIRITGHRDSVHRFRHGPHSRVHLGRKRAWVDGRRMPGVTCVRLRRSGRRGGDGRRAEDNGAPRQAHAV